MSNRAHSLYLRPHSCGQMPWDFLSGFWLWRSARHSSVVMVAFKTLTLAEWGNRQFFQSSICFCQKMPQELHIMTWNACDLIDSLQFGFGTPALLYMSVINVLYTWYVANVFAPQASCIMMVENVGEGPEFALWSNSKSCASVPTVHQPSVQILAARPTTWQMA